MSSFTYTADESRDYPTLGVTAEPGGTYELADGVEPPEDGRWAVVAPVGGGESKMPTPTPTPAPEPQAAPAAAGAPPAGKV